MNSIFDESLPIKDFGSSDIDLYILKINETNEYHGERKCLLEKIKGQKLFKSKFINDFKFVVENCNVRIAAKVRAEMKKTSYDVHLIIASDNEILDASCQCAGGASPADCKHVFAVLHFISEYCSKDLHNAPTEVLQQWHQPSKRVRCSPKKVQDFVSPAVFMKKPKTDVDFSALVNLPYCCPLFSVLDDQKFDYDEVIYSSSIKLPLADESAINTFSIPENISEKELIFFKESVKLTQDEYSNIERNTMNQNNDLWKSQRKIRLTASNFHKIISRRGNFHELSLSLLQPPDLSHLPAIRYGKESEGLVKRKLAAKFPDYKFRNVGLVINEKFPFLGASPDGLFFNENECFLIEIKTVYSNEKVEMHDLLTRSNFCLKTDDDGNLTLRKNHIYYHQVQGQLAVTNVSYCLFVLYYGQDDLFCQKIVKSEVYWDINFPKLKDFFFNVHLKNILKFHKN